MNRVWVVGPCGSGKSTVADRLGHRLGLKATHLDELFWKPGWQHVEEDELARQVGAVTEGTRWIIDGNYHRVRGMWGDCADLFVWLDFPLRVTLPRLLRRCLDRILTGETICNGNRETIRQTFASRDSILYWAVTAYHGQRKELSAYLAARPHVRLPNQRSVDTWLRTLRSRPSFASCMANAYAG